MPEQKVNRFLITVAILVVVFSIFKTIKNDKNEQQLRLENNYVIGEITHHKVFGTASYYIYYKYKVNGTEYSKSVNNSFKYSDCYRSRNCIGIKHPVYFDLDNPNNSFMDFYSTELDIKKIEYSKKRFKEQINKLKN